MNATTDLMSRKQSKRTAPAESEDARLPSVQVRIPGEVFAALEALAKEEWTTVPTQVVLATKLYLSHKGRPLPERKSD